jgi:hypothetical protein
MPRHHALPAEPPPKAPVEHQNRLADGPTLRRNGPRSKLSALVARTVLAHVESVRILSFLRDELEKRLVTGPDPHIYMEVSGTIIRGTLKTPNSQLVTPISIKLQRPDGYD